MMVGRRGANKGDREVFHVRLPLRRQLEELDARPLGAVDVHCPRKDIN